MDFHKYINITFIPIGIVVSKLTMNINTINFTVYYPESIISTDHSIIQVKL
jgi:hypothetical protein